MLGGVGRIGRIGQGRFAPVDPGPPGAGPDFTIEFQTITNSWGTQTVATLIPNAAAIAAGIRFELVGETAGLAVVNG